MKISERFNERAYTINHGKIKLIKKDLGYTMA
jgi:hypothetical protein